MRIPFMLVAVVVGTLAAGCGSEGGEPLIAGALTADYEGTAFVPVNGFATTYQNKGLIVLGTGSVHCGSETANEPPSGKNAIIAIPTLDVGTYGNVLVQISSTSGGSYHSSGSTAGSVTITASTADSVTGMVTFDFTNSTTQKHYGVAGTFEAVHCK